MRYKLSILAFGGALAFGVSALAQDNAAQPPAQTPGNTQSLAQDNPGQPGTPGPRRMDANRQLEHMTRALGLSADQQNQIRPVLVDRQQKVEALFQDQSIARQDRRAKMQSIRQDTQTRIEAVLNDQQKQKFEAMQEHMRGRGGRGGAQEGAPQPQ
jgi:hypothetical protein